MSISKRLELAEKRGRLSARIQAQRETLARQTVPLADALAVADRGVALAERAKHFVQRQPAVVGGAVALLFVLRPRRVFRWSRRAWLLWKTVGALRQRFNPE